MGIIISTRPPVGAKQGRTIAANLRRHFELMEEFLAQGFDRETASSLALELLRKENTRKRSR